jgi:hypothetical protein
MPVKAITVNNYKEDRYYNGIVDAVSKLLEIKRDIAPVEVLMEMGLLQSTALNDWKLGRISYLEKVIGCNLGKIGRILRILRFHAYDLNLGQRLTFYNKRGKPLRFSKTGDAKIEEAYRRHFVAIGKTSKFKLGQEPILDQPKEMLLNV